MKNDYPDGNEEYDAQWPSHRSDPLTPPPHGTLEHAKDDTQLSGLSPRELRLRAFSVRVGVIRGVNSPADPRKPFHIGQGRPVSRILLYPAIHLRGFPGLPEGSRAYQPDAVRPNNLACSHRWFTWPAPRGIPPVGSYPTLSPITCDRAARSIGWSALCCT